MLTVAKSWSIVIVIVVLTFGSVGMVLHAADDVTVDTPEDVLSGLFGESEWTSQWMEEAQAYQVVFKGPDVWVRISGDYVMVQSYLGRVPKEVANNALLGLLRRNYDVYEGKFALDRENDLWFETSTASRILDTKQLDQQIAVVADAAAKASDIIKTETPQTAR